MTSHGIFITGTDTGVGKTFIGQRLVRSLQQRGIGVAPRKPAESGCCDIGGQRVGGDCTAYFNACDERVPLETITPYRYLAELAPPAAATLENRTLSMAMLINACQVNENEFLVAEGAGGWLSPIANNGLNADLASQLRRPVLLVAANRLGCINHIMLTLESVQARGLQVAAVVLNQITADASGESNQHWLDQNLSIPLVVYDGRTEAIDALADIVTK